MCHYSRYGRNVKPFYLIEDGNFQIPVASLDQELFAEIEEKVMGKELVLSVVSRNSPATAYQLIASKKVPNPKGTIVLCAHMDTKYHTNGALDNASGVVTMLKAAEGLANDRYNIEIVPFNTEEYYDPQGELIYLEAVEKNEKPVSLLINIDTVAHAGSKVAIASFNFNEKEQLELDNVINSSPDLVRGDPWYAGDHAVFAFKGIKCVLVFASDLFDRCLSYTHCPKDTIDLVDEKLVESAARFIRKIVNAFQ